MSLEFQPWPKIARLNRDITITEKLDGTNAAVVIVPASGNDPVDVTALALIPRPDWREAGIADYAVVFAQSRTRLITPENDNYGFARWVQRNAEALVNTLGEGTHYGEWWGAGIQRKYGLTGNDKRFSLFNTARWAGGTLEAQGGDLIPGLGVVPVLYEGLYDDYEIEKALDRLRDGGSVAAPGFGYGWSGYFGGPSAEGVVIYHHASREMYKITLENDAAPKGAAGHALDNEQKVAA